MASIEAVCFDLDDTLCVRNQSLREIHEAVHERVDIEPFYTPADIRAVDFVDLPPADSPQEFYEDSFRAIAENVGGDTEHAPTLAEATVTVVDETAVSFRRGAEQALEYTSKRYDIGLITNGTTEIQTAKLEKLGIRDVFDTVVICNPEADIPSKPDPEPFALALTNLDATPETTAHVGDSYDSDVVGAHNAGLQSIWVPPSESHENYSKYSGPAPTYQLDSMNDVSDVL